MFQHWIILSSQLSGLLLEEVESSSQCWSIADFRSLSECLPFVR
nr:MAG TPA: hypothetical protein [Caudoviricetes sp.]